MNARIAALLLSRLVGLPWIDKTAGLVRVAKKKLVSGKEIRFPVGCNVTDAVACHPSSVAELSPDTNFISVLYFEDRGAVVVNRTKTKGTSYTSKLRLVVWVNTPKLGDACATGDAVQLLAQAAIEGDGRRYNSGVFRSVLHRITSVAVKDAGIFSRYTYDDAGRQLFAHPFDYFALDIDTEFRLIAGCEEDLNIDPTECWTPVPGSVTPPTPQCPVVRTCGDPSTGDILIWNGAAWMPGSSQAVTDMLARVVAIEAQLNGYSLGDPDINGQIPITRTVPTVVDLKLSTTEP